MNNYRQHVLSAKSLTHRIHNDDEWKWALGDANLGVLEECIKSLEKVVNESPFILDYLTMDVTYVKKNYGAEFPVLIKQIPQKLDELTEKLMGTCRRLGNMQKANLAQRRQA